MERRLYDLLETLLQARYTKDRQSLLRQANLSLEVLRFQMRLARRAEGRTPAITSPPLRSVPNRSPMPPTP